VPPSAEPIVKPEEPAEPAPAAAPAIACGCCPCALADAGAGEGGVEAVTTAVPAATPPASSTTFTISGTLTSAPASKPAAFAVVYLEDAPIEPTAKMTATIDNRSMAFIPFVTVIPAGGKVAFHNSDPFPHNVFSPDAEKFNMGTISQNQGMLHSFRKAGTYSLLCNLHPGMLGYVVVTPSSYFAKTDAKGHYAITAVPPGTYSVAAWAPRLPVATQSAAVKGADVTIDFELHR
jgi:plastocyanin